MLASASCPPPELPCRLVDRWTKNYIETHVELPRNTHKDTLKHTRIFWDIQTRTP